MTLKVHVIKCTANPTLAPTEVGQHWINTSTGDHFLSSGTTGVGDWELITSSTASAVSLNDTTPDFLGTKIQADIGTNPTNAFEESILNPSSNEILRLRFDETKVNHTQLQNIGTNSHADIDTYIATRQHFLQYTTNANQTTTGNLTLSFATDLNSVPGTSFTKSSATEFRCDFTGVAEIHYNYWAQVAQNDRGAEVGILLNGSPLTYTFRRQWGKDANKRSGSASGTFYVPVAATDLISFRLTSLEGASCTINTNSIVALLRRI